MGAECLPRTSDLDPLCSRCQSGPGVVGWIPLVRHAFGRKLVGDGVEDGAAKAAWASSSGAGRCRGVGIPLPAGRRGFSPSGQWSVPCWSQGSVQRLSARGRVRRRVRGSAGGWLPVGWEFRGEGSRGPPGSVEVRFRPWPGHPPVGTDQAVNTFLTCGYAWIRGPGGWFPRRGPVTFRYRSRFQPPEPLTCC